MSDTSSKVAAIGIAELIDQIYATALDPSCFPVFITQWRHAIDQNLLDFSELTPHFEQAEQLLARLEKADEYSKQPLHVSPHIAFQIDSEGNMHSANDLAQQFVSKQDRLPITPSAEKKLRQLAMDISVTQSPRLERFVTTTSPGNQNIMFLVSNISRIPIRPASALVVCTTVIWADGLNELLRQEFQFSKAELEIIRMLVEGKTSREIAEFRSRSWETIRTQLRKILSKAGVESQLDLVRLVLGYPIAASLKSKQLVSEPWGQFIVHEIKDGRFIEYINAGQQTGRQILFLHGSEPRHMISRVFLKELLNQGASVLAPLRPGYGTTSLPQKETDASSELATIADLLGKSEEIEIIACGTGFRTALQFANAYPQRVKKLWVSEPVFPNEFLAVQDSNEVPWATSLSHAPEAIGFLVKVSDTHIRRSGLEDYLSRDDTTSLDTKKMLADTHSFSEMVWSNELIGRGLEGVISDLHSMNEDWLDEIRICKTRMTILETGNSDTPETSKALLSLNPTFVTTQRIHTKERLAFYVSGIAKIFL